MLTSAAVQAQCYLEPIVLEINTQNAVTACIPDFLEDQSAQSESPCNLNLYNTTAVQTAKLYSKHACTCSIHTLRNTVSRHVVHMHV